MLTRVLRFLQGYVRIQITGYSPERFLNLCRYHEIPIWGLESRRRAYEMFLSVRGFKKIKPIVKKTNTKIKVLKKYGAPFFLFRYRKRKLFFAGCLGCLVIIYALSLFVWDIQIEGNYKKTDETILAFLRKESILCGMPKSKVNCQEIAKMIRKEFEDVIWVSAALEGSQIIISVKENSDSKEIKTTEKSEEGTDLIADKEGIIREITTRAGIPQVHEGDSVKKGDLLVSGRVEIRNDSQEVVRYQYQDADADIRIETEQNYEDQLSLFYDEKKYKGRKKYQIYWKTGEKEYTFGRNAGQKENTEIHSSEIRLGFSKSFQLPFSVGIRTIKTYENVEKKYTEKEVQVILSNHFERFCKDLRKKGVQILENNVKIDKDNDIASARGTVTLLETCGKERKTEHGNLREND